MFSSSEGRQGREEKNMNGNDGWKDGWMEKAFLKESLARDLEKTRPTPYSRVRLLRPLEQKTKRLKDKKTKRLNVN